MRSPFSGACLVAGTAILLGGCASLSRSNPHTSAEPAYDSGMNRPARLALVLSAGTMRGFAHVGVLRELKAQGIEPDLIVGSSAGAIVGALVASGASEAELDAAVDAAASASFAELRSTRRGLLGGGGIHQFVDQHAKHDLIERFPVRFAAVAVEAERSCLQIFNTGDPGKAAQASSTVPVLLTPPRIEGRQYLDGALISPLPVHVARALGAQRVIAVDVTFEPAERSFFDLVEGFSRTNLVTRWALAINEGMEADYVIKPWLMAEPRIGMATRRELVEAGADAVRRGMPAIRAALQAEPKAKGGSVHPALAQMSCPEQRLSVSP